MERSKTPEANSSRNKSRSISTLCKNITRLYHAPTADFNFVFDVDDHEELVPVHKCILASQSPVFRQMFYGELKEKGDVKLTDTTIHAFIEFLEYIYYDRDVIVVEILPRKLQPLLYLAHKYHVEWLEKWLKEIFDDHIRSNIPSILWIFPLADLYSYDALREKCIDGIRLHGASLIQSAEILGCDKKVLSIILANDFANRNEVEVFKTCMDWAKRACIDADLDPELPENLREQLGDSFDLIRFNSMTSSDFVQCLAINAKVFSHDEIERIANSFSKGQQPKKRPTFINETGESKYINTQEREANIFALFGDQDLADVCFVFENENDSKLKRLPAHKCILAASSKIFADLIGKMQNTNGEIRISEVSTDIFIVFVKLIYAIDCDQMKTIFKEIPDQNIEPIMSLATEYEVLHITSWFELYLEDYVDKQNVFRRFDLTLKHPLYDLQSKCVKLIKENCAELLESESFLNASQPALKEMLKRRFWNDAKTMIDVSMKWAKKKSEDNQLDLANAKNLRASFGDAIEFIPFTSLDPLEFIEFQRDYRGMLTSHEVEKVINDFAAAART